MSNPNRVVPIPAFRKEDYATALAIFEDRNQMPGTWEQWEEVVKDTEKAAKASGLIAQRVYIDPHSFVAWCRQNGLGVNTEAREKFIRFLLA